MNFRAKNLYEWKWSLWIIKLGKIMLIEQTLESKFWRFVILCSNFPIHLFTFSLGASRLGCFSFDELCFFITILRSMNIIEIGKNSIWVFMTEIPLYMNSYFLVKWNFSLGASRLGCFTFDETCTSILSNIISMNFSKVFQGKSLALFLWIKLLIN